MIIIRNKNRLLKAVFLKVMPYKELKQAKDFDFTISGNQNKELKQAKIFDSPNLANQKSKRGGDVRSVDYILTINMAKEKLRFFRNIKTG